MRDLLLTGLNHLMRAQGKGIAFATVVSGGMDGAMYGSYRVKTNRGAHYHVTVFRSRGQLRLKSLLKIVDKWERYTYLCNGQAGTNTKMVLGYNEGTAPVLGDLPATEETVTHE